MTNLKIKGIIYIELLDGNNNIIKQSTVENIITNDGMNAFIKAAVGEYDYVADRMVIGLGNTPQNQTDTKLENKILHNEISYEIVDGSVVYHSRFPIGAVEKNNWIREIGLAYFDGSKEILVTRAVLDADKEIFITPNNTLNLKYQLNIASA